MKIFQVGGSVRDELLGFKPKDRDWVVVNSSPEEMENNGLFPESVTDKKTGQKRKFFNLGPKSNWQEVLDQKISNDISNNFKKEMEELGYI